MGTLSMNIFYSYS